MLSIVIPVYNLENCIERTLDSVCRQTYRDLEIIVVDDGSTDSSVSVITKYAEKDSRITVVEQKNGGVTSARLNGVKKSHGEWIGFVDGDDEIDPDMFETLISNADKYGADISHCGYQMIFSDGRIHYFHATGVVREQDTNTGLKDLIDGNLVEPGLWNKIYKRSLFDSLFDNSALDRSIKENEDLLMNYLLFGNSHKSVFVDECKYHYIVRENSASRRINKNTIYDPIKVKQIILDVSSDELKPIVLSSFISTCISMYSRLSVYGKSYNNDLKNIRAILIDNKSNSHLLKRNQRILYYFIVKTPTLFRLLYSTYSKYFQKKKYS